MNLSPDGAARAALTRYPPGTFRWIIEDDGLRELLVIDAHLMPGELVRYAKMAFSTFVFPTKYAMSVDELTVSMEDEFAWTSGCWPPGSLAEYAITARIPAGTFANRVGRSAKRQMALQVPLPGHGPLHLCGIHQAPGAFRM